MKKLIIISSLLLISKMSVAQSGWTVNPSLYSFSMNVTTTVSIQCVELMDPQDEIGAFVGGVCRGVVKTSNIVNGRYLAFLTVYSNAASGENVTFKIYDASAGTITDAATAVIFQDGAAYGFPTTPFGVYSNNQPTDIALSNSNFYENSFPQFVGKLSTVDIDPQSHSYSLVAGTGSTDNAKFMVSNDSLYINTKVNFEAVNTLSVRLQTNDGDGCSFQKAFTISVLDTNDNPTKIHLTNNLVNENSPMNTVVGTFSTTDEDVNDQFTYQLVAGLGDVNNGLFTIAGNAELRVVGAINFEQEDSLYIRVRTTDAGGLFVDSAFIITVQDVNEVPYSINLDTLQFSENIPLGTTIITLATLDQDSLDNHTYSFDNSQVNDNAAFIIIGNEIQNTQLINFENKSSYTIYIKSDDGNGGVYTQQVILSVIDINDLSTDILLSGTSVEENNVPATFIATLSTVDEDANDAYTYSLVSGAGDADNGSFTVQNDSLFITVSTDFETKETYSIRLRSTDTSLATFDKVFAVNVLDINDLPTGIALSDTALDENLAIGSTVALLSTIDTDLGGTYSYQLVSGAGSTDNAKFAIQNNQLVTASNVDFEAQVSYSVRIQTNDFGGGSFQQAFILTVNDVNEKPIAYDAAFEISENANLYDSVGTVLTFDEDANTTLTFEVIGETDFTIDATGKLTLNTNLDYEVTKEYVLYVKITDQGGLKDTAEVLVTVLDEMETDAPLPVNKILSPNGDGSNDFFKIANVQLYKDFKLTIFNDAGLVVYTKESDYDNTWAGTYNGTELNSGVYFYLLQNNTNASILYKGQLSIIK